MAAAPDCQGAALLCGGSENYDSVRAGIIIIIMIKLKVSIVLIVLIVLTIPCSLRTLLATCIRFDGELPWIRTKCLDDFRISFLVFKMIFWNSHEFEFVAHKHPHESGAGFFRIEVRRRDCTVDPVPGHYFESFHIFNEKCWLNRNSKTPRN